MAEATPCTERTVSDSDDHNGIIYDDTSLYGVRMEQAVEEADPIAGRRRVLLTVLVVAAVGIVGFVTLVSPAFDRSSKKTASRSNGTADSGASKGGFTGGDFHSLVADPAVADRVFVGGHQAVSVSSDGGSSWVEIGSLADADAMGWSFSGDAVWVSGHPGIVNSSDNMKTVEQRNGGLPDTDIHALGGSGNVLYAAGPRIGVLKSVDNGVVWTTATSSVGQSFFGRILVDPNDVNHIVAADPLNGVLASNDAGVTWKQLTDTPASWVSSPDGLDTLYASGAQAATRSNDRGATWSPLALPETATTVEADPTTPTRLYAGAHDGNRVRVWSSIDDGATWEAR